MPWIKDVIVDITVTLFIAIAFILSSLWMWWIIVVYTLLLLLAKGVVLTGKEFLRQTKKSPPAPEWFIHLLYALNVLLLALTSWWYLFVAWLLIWLFSYLGKHKMTTV